MGCADAVARFLLLLWDEEIVDKSEIYKHLTIKGSLSARLPPLFDHLLYPSHSCQRERIFIDQLHAAFQDIQGIEGLDHAVCIHIRICLAAF